MEYIYNIKCHKCNEIIPFFNPNFCCYCGEKVTDEDRLKGNKMNEQQYQEYQCRQKSW